VASRIPVGPDAPTERKIVITDDFGERVQMSADQFAVLIEEARSGLWTRPSPT
jgi:hypothetical protein